MRKLLVLALAILFVGCEPIENECECILETYVVETYYKDGERIQQNVISSAVVVDCSDEVEVDFLQVLNCN